MVLGCPSALCWDRKVLVTLVVWVVSAIFVKPGGAGFGSFLPLATREILKRRAKQLRQVPKQQIPLIPTVAPMHFQKSPQYLNCLFFKWISKPPQAGSFQKAQHS